MKSCSIETNSFYKALISYRTDIVSVTDVDGFYLYHCDAKTPALGWKPEELTDTNMLDYIHKVDREAVARSLTNALSQTNFLQQEYRFKAKSGQWRWLESEIINFMDNESINGLLIRSRDITEKREAEIKEKENFAYYKSLFHHHPDSVFRLSREGIIEDINDSNYKILGYSKEEVIGQNFLAFSDPSTRDFAIKSFEKALTGEPDSYETIAVHKNGKILAVCVTSVPVVIDGKVVKVHGIVRDITPVKQAHEQLLEQSEINQKLLMVANVVTNGVLILDKKGRIEWINTGFTKLTGFTSEEAKGKKPGDLLRGSELDQVSLARKRADLIKGIPFSEDVLHHKKNGDKLWSRIDATPVLDEAGILKEFFVILTDITQEKESEEDLYKQNRDLQQFTYIVSHNLRAPMANILGLTDLLSKVSKDNPVFDQVLSKLTISSKSLDTVIKDMSTILAVKKNADINHQEHVPLQEIIQQVQESLQSALAECGATLTFEVMQECILFTNKAYAYSIFYNLISNAIKYRSKDRKLKIKIRCYTNKHGEMEIQVRDNGSGMDLKLVGKQLFQLYKRFDVSVEGRGMGLYLVKTQVEALGGTIEVKSQPDKGTTFTIKFRNK